MSPRSNLHTLIDILPDAAGCIEDQYASAGLELPSLDEFDPSKPANFILFDPILAQQASVVVAATEQLSVVFMVPQSVHFFGKFSARLLATDAILRHAFLTSVTKLLVYQLYVLQMYPRSFVKQVRRYIPISYYNDTNGYE